MIRFFLIALILGGPPSFAQAQHSHKGPNGGEVVDAVEGPFHVELLAKGTELVVFVLDQNNKPAPVAGATGRVVIQAGGKTLTVSLQFSEPNKLAGNLAAPLSKGARIVLSGKLGDGRPLQARFVQR